jgi:hypothetical protein
MTEKSKRHSVAYEPTASLTHFLMWLSLAAPASFLSAADLSQAVFASVSHFFMNEVIAAPASFLSVASTLQEAAKAVLATSESAAAKTIDFMSFSHFDQSRGKMLALVLALTLSRVFDSVKASRGSRYFVTEISPPVATSGPEKPGHSQQAGS